MSESPTHKSDPAGHDKDHGKGQGPDKDKKSPAPVDKTRSNRGLTSSGGVKRTRAGILWVGLVAAAVLAILLLVFIAQNSAKVTINFLGWDGQLSLAVALLLSAVIGVLVVALPGTARIIQLRNALRKNAKD